jgi:DNA polymerase/3'-5' exonuclease PolX
MNNNIINEFTRLVDYIKLQLSNAIKIKKKDDSQKHTFRLRQIKRVLDGLIKHDKEITLENAKGLIAVPGIGKGSIHRIIEILETGKLEELKDFNNKIIDINIIKELEEVIGIGKSTAIELINKYNVSSVQDLIKKYKKNKLELNNTILLGLKYHNKFKKKIPREEIDDVYIFIKKITNQFNKSHKLINNNKLCAQICGSYRREKPFSNDIDIILTKYSTKIKDRKKDSIYLKKFVEILREIHKPFLIDDLTNINYKYMGFCKYKNYPIRRIDIIFIPFDSFYTALVYFTGSRELNLEIRKIAKKKGYKLNEYELFDTKNNKKIKINSEKELFNKLGLDYIEPKFR